SSGLNRNTIDVEKIEVIVALGPKTERRGDIGNSRCVEVRPYHLRPDNVVALRGKPSRDRLISGIAQRENNPTRIGAGRFGGDGHAANDCICAWGRLNTYFIAAPFVELTEKRNVDLLVIRSDNDWFDRPCLGCATNK